MADGLDKLIRLCLTPQQKNQFGAQLLGLSVHLNSRKETALDLLPGNSPRGPESLYVVTTHAIYVLRADGTDTTIPGADVDMAMIEPPESIKVALRPDSPNSEADGLTIRVADKDRANQFNNIINVLALQDLWGQPERFQRIWGELNRQFQRGICPLCAQVIREEKLCPRCRCPVPDEYRHLADERFTLLSRLIPEMNRVRQLYGDNEHTRSYLHEAEEFFRVHAEGTIDDRTLNDLLAESQSELDEATPKLPQQGGRGGGCLLSFVGSLISIGTV